MDRNYSFFAIIPRYVSLSLSLSVVERKKWFYKTVEPIIIVGMEGKIGGVGWTRCRVRAYATNIRKVVTRCGCSVQVSLGSSGDRELETRTRMYIYIYIHRVRIMQASPLSTFRLRIWVGHELIVYNESALNRRVDAMRQRATLGVYRDFCNWNVFRTLMHASNPIGRSRLFLW